MTIHSCKQDSALQDSAVILAACIVPDDCRAVRDVEGQHDGRLLRDMSDAELYKYREDYLVHESEMVLRTGIDGFVQDENSRRWSAIAGVWIASEIQRRVASSLGGK